MGNDNELYHLYINIERNNIEVSDNSQLELIFDQNKSKPYSFCLNLPQNNSVPPQNMHIHPKKHLGVGLINVIGFLKFIIMNKLFIIITVSLLVSLGLNAQEVQNRNGLKFKAFTIGVGGYKADYSEKISSFSDGSTTTTRKQYQAGISAFIDVSFYLRKHIFSASILGGMEPELIYDSGTNASFYSFNLLYGRELEVKKWFKIEGHLGLGFYAQERRVDDVIINPSDQRPILLGDKIQKDTTLGVPANLKFTFYVRKHIGLGFMSEAIFNSLNTTYTGNIFFHVKLP